MKKQTSNLDEMQEQKLLKIEHTGCWLAFWGLLSAILLQTVFFNDRTAMLGEYCVFMVLAAYLLFACIKNGIWDRKLRPSLKTNVICSASAGLVSGGVIFVHTFLNYRNLPSSFLSAALVFLSTFVLCIIALSAFAKIYQRKIEKIEKTCED